MRNEFDNQLKQLNRQLITMGSLCEEAIALSAKALQGMPDHPEQQVPALEREIDQLEREIESSCMNLLLRQQPVAQDLRTISAALRMITDLERIGDQAADISELVPHICDSNLPSKPTLSRMAQAVVLMVTDSVDAFVKKDLAMARRVQQNDDEVDALFDQVKQELMALVEHRGIGAEAALDVLMAAKYFERIGDHATNVAEWVEYALTGIHKNLLVF